MVKTHRKILRLKQVSEFTGLSNTTIWRREQAGIFPKRVSLGANSVGWYEDEILDFINNLPRGGCEAPEKAIDARRA